ncbi:MAG: PspC domain-containing protein [Flavobacteriales bacterium]|nr:PspC domain-containing protein [Flavobacteriales bacterium]
MKKTFTANLNGTVFHIEEDAYDQLQRYLANIRAKFSGSAEAEEIMADIEARIAELFTERLQGRQAVSLADVDHVKQVMGQPEDYVDDETGTGGSSAGERSYQHSGSRKNKRLFRDPEDRWVGGVIGGLANYFGTEPLWFRIAFIVVLIAGWGSPVLLYLVLWALIPEASTAAERLEMQGEPVTVDNIKRVFEEGTERVKAGGERMAHEARDLGKNWGRRSRGTGTRAGEIILKLIWVALIIFGVSLLLGLVTALIGGSVSLWHSTWGSDDISLLDLGGYVFNSPAQVIWAGLALLLLVALPILGIFLAGFRLLLGSPAPRWLSWTISLVWIAALILMVVTCVNLANDFRRETTVRKEVSLVQPVGNTMYLDMLQPQDSLNQGWSVSYKHGWLKTDMSGIHVDNGNISGAWGQLDVQRSPDSLYHLLVLREARGRTVKVASARAGNIGFDYRQQDNVLQLSPVVRFSITDKVRAQEVRFIVQVPLEKSVFFREGSRTLLDDIDNTTNTYDGNMVGRTWTMTSRGLEDPEDPAPNAPHPVPAPTPVTPSPQPPAAPTAGTTISYQGTGPAMPNLLQLLSAGFRP